VHFAHKISRHNTEFRCYCFHFISVQKYHDYSLSMPIWGGLEWCDVKTQFHECCLWYSKTSINSCTQRWL